MNYYLDPHVRNPFINHKTYHGTSICIQNGFYKNFTFLPIMVDSKHAIQYQIAFILRMMPLSLCTQIMNRIYEVISNLWHSKSLNAIYVKCTSLVVTRKFRLRWNLHENNVRFAFRTRLLKIFLARNDIWFPIICWRLH